MGLARVTAGRDLPRDFNVIVEIPANSAPIKYEVDKESVPCLSIVSSVRRCTIPAITAIFRRRLQTTATRLTCAF